MHPLYPDVSVQNNHRNTFQSFSTLSSLEPKLSSGQLAEAVFDLRVTEKAQVSRSGAPGDDPLPFELQRRVREPALPVRS